jgi:predicted nucleotidyltransferase
MGSNAYGVATNDSDLDVYGFCIPPKTVVFPHLNGEIDGFGKQKPRFAQWQQHHIDDPDSGKEYDFSVYSIVKFFHLCMENNPNMLDALFVPRNCIIHSTKIAEIVRENRQLFLHKGSYHKLKGYAYAQLHKMKEKNPIGKRVETVEKFGYDVKYAYHLVRLIGQCEQILVEHDLILNDQTRMEHMKAIRRGEVTEDAIIKFFEEKEITLEKLYRESTLQHSPDEEKIKSLLLNCLEEHYGTLEAAYSEPNQAINVLKSIAEIVEKNRTLLNS